MNKKKLWLLYPVLALVLAFSVAVPALPVNAQAVPLPHNFYGSLTIATEPAPVGTEVEARGVGVMPGIEGNPITTTDEGQYGDPGALAPKLKVMGYIDEGTPIEFYIDEARAQCREQGTETWLDTYPWHSDGLTELDLTIAADVGPVASFTADPTSGEYPLEVSFTDTSTSHDGITSWAWDFSYDVGLGFNVESTVQNPDYTYLTEGIHTVALRVTEADADSDMKVEENLITVTPPTPPTVESTLPLDAATDVAIDVVVSATFDEDIQEGANFGDITIISEATGVSASIAGATLTIAHDAFAYGTSYTVTIPAGAVDDLDDNALVDPEVWSFTTLVQYELIVSSTAGGTVTSPVEGTSTHDAGTVVNLVAVAEASYAFVNWSGHVTTIGDVNAASTTILMDSDKTIVANFVLFSAPANVSITEADPGVESVTVTIEPLEEVDVSEMPAGMNPQEAYVVTPTGTGSFTLVFTDVSNASDIRVYKVVDSTWTLLEVTVIDATTIEITMDVADPVLVFALPPITSVNLSADWNLLSTPILLDVDSDSLGQIFGTDVGNIDVSYGWDAQDVQWALLTNDYELLPLYAIYVKVSSGASATAEFIISAERSELPSRELQPGLNLIGPAPALEEGAFPDMPLDQALISIAEAEGGLIGYTIVVSPAHNQPGWAYALGGEIKDLLPFDGFWVVLENGPDTLWGFSTTPIE